MSTTRLETKKSNDKVDDENACASKVTRSVTLRRPASASGVRSKIPTIVNQNNPGSFMTDPQLSSTPSHNIKVLNSQGKPLRRFPSRNGNSSLSKNKISPLPSNVQRHLENQFKNKKNRYLNIRNEIEEKQKNALDIYDEISELRKKIIASGLKDPGKVEGIKLIPDNSNKCRENENLRKESGEHGAFINASVTREFASILENELREYPKECVNLCEEMIEKYSALVEWTNNFCRDKCESPEIIEKVDQFKNVIEHMKLRLEATKKILDDSNGNLIRKIILMWDEIEGARLRIRDLETISDEVVNNLRMNLNSEVEKFNQLQEQKTLVDNELKKTNTRIQKLEETIAANHNEMYKYQEYIKSLESQLKQNDINFERETRDLHKSLKNSEEMIISLESQRNNLESRLVEMKENLDKIKNNDIEKEVNVINQELVKHQNLIAKLKEEKLSVEEDLKNKLQKEKDLVIKLTEDYGRLQNEHEFMEKKFKDLEDQIMELNIQNSQKVQLFSSTEFIKLNGDYEQEIALFQRKNMELETDLNAVKNKLQLQEQTLREQHQRIQVQDELISYLTKSANHSNFKSNANVQELTKEIAAKSETIKILTVKLEEKEIQLTHLEKLVKQMEDQEGRSQEQRTRLEKRIAQLELTLEAKNNKDYRYVLDRSNSSTEECELPRHADSPSKQTHSLKKQNSKTFTTVPSSLYESLYNYNIKLVKDEMAKSLELEKKYKKYKNKSRYIEGFYKWLIESKEMNRHSHTSRCDSSHNSVVNPRHVIDVDSYAYQIVDQCGREIESLNSNFKYKSSQCWSHSSKKMKHNNKTFYKDSFPSP
ncbi:GRIP and coiled-coil domain-containing protein 2-like [Chelonus insularis]|uniref:GRIP and coiled-coil domain-containing protein 2-like n=1 Tax=Chelonus insularis TaxID=460826 RepID=UPI00158D1008|nr:GRIP and coiled-coil domain-containing protein 2-like [Chelonus insularis]